MALTTSSGASSTDYTTITGTSGKDTFDLKTDPKLISVVGLAGADTVDVTGSATDYSVRGGEGADTITFKASVTDAFINGNTGDDDIVISGTATTVTIEGGQGVDDIDVARDLVSSIVQGRIGNDQIDVTLATTGSTINGNEDDDTIALAAKATDSKIYGGADNDTITVVESENVLVSGGKGADDLNLNGKLTNATVNGNAGADDIDVGSVAVSKSTIYGGAGKDSINFTGSGDLYVSGDKDADTLDMTSSTGENTVLGGTGDDTITLGSGDSSADGGEGADTITDAAAGDHTAIGGAGDDTITLNGGGAISVLGGAGADTITGGAGADTINGNAGKDKITSGAGKDSLNGGADDDTFVFGNGELTADDTVAGDLGTDIVEFAAGTGALTVADNNFAGVKTVETIKLSSTAETGVDAQSLTLGSNTQAAGITKIDSSAIADSEDHLTVDASAFTTALTFIGHAGEDTITGGSAADSFTTGAQGIDANETDDFTGGAGDDTFTIEAVQDTNIEDLSGGDVFTVSAGAQDVDAKVTAAYTATSAVVNKADAVDDVALTAQAGSFDIDMSGATATVTGFTISAHADGGGVLTGTSKVDNINGAAGKDTLIGGGGADILDGMGGADAYTIGTGATEIVHDEADGVANSAVIDRTSGVAAADTDKLNNLTWTFANGVDVVTGFTADDFIDSDAFASADAVAIGTSDVGDIADNTAYVAYGTWNATAKTFAAAAAFNAASAKDAMIFYSDAADKAGITQASSIILDDLAAALGASNMV